MADPKDINKDTVYIDIDDEITAIIEKVRASSQKNRSVGAAQRASVLQSIVNMKLPAHGRHGQQEPSAYHIRSRAVATGWDGRSVCGAQFAEQTGDSEIDGADADDLDDLDEPGRSRPFQLAAATTAVGDLAVSSSVPLVGAASKSSYDRDAGAR